MAYTPKRKKLEKKSAAAEPVIETNQKFYCCRCGIAYSRQKGYFPVSHSPMYRGSGYVPICNECIEKMFEEYLKKFGDERAAMKRLCMKMDLYWNDSIYDMVEKTVATHSKVRSYIGKANLIRYIDKTYDDTIDDESRSVISVTNIPNVVLPEQNKQGEIEIPQEVISFWGPGYTPEMYLELEQRREHWMSRLPEGTKMDIGTDVLIRNGCMLELDITRNRLDGKSVERSIKALNDVLGSLNVKPEQKRDSADADAERTPMGVWIQRWEEQRPIPEPDPELQDHDGVVRYVTTWFLGHLCKMLGIRNGYCKLYEDAMREKAEELSFEEDVEIDEDLFNDIFSSFQEKAGDED